MDAVGDRISNGDLGASLAARTQLPLPQFGDALRELPHDPSNFFAMLGSIVREPTDRTVELRPLTPAQSGEFTRRLESQFIWVDDGWCLQRAAYGAELITRDVAPDETDSLTHARSAAVAVLDGPIDGHPGWDYHAATAWAVEGVDEPMVYDKLAAAEAMPLSQWARHYGVEPDSVRLIASSDKPLTYADQTRRIRNTPEAIRGWAALLDHAPRMDPPGDRYNG